MKQRQKQSNGIYQVGIADAFINGLYKGTLSVGTLKSNGDFGIGAPNLVDGELTFYNGKVYQTRWNGVTTEAPDSLTTPFAFVSFFKPETTFHINGFTGKEAILERVEKYLKNKNGMYAIRISGKFHHVKTRAFPPVTREPFLPLANMLDKQFFFDFNNTEGVLIGYKLPSYLAGVNIAGYHFHFLTSQLNAGGHALDFSSDSTTIEISRISDFQLVTPDDPEFMNYKFDKVNQPDLQKVEKGN
ncbi:acetolactate decarboxylase [Mucilaginibacter sp. BJC16-A38]|uniref:acetolactate decarboxylase n=1 Tax=Mucilaginibacter phenanthrenivorans TaxID=1234842 RepID=UPI0021586D9D|nr:acetolactate decarboxylase [Mucilaginibacter phenanthrenivorans]MCR8557356.1 acetolactate decarboxylase [Mucilaginibacter phenanthrenivorans]